MNKLVEKQMGGLPAQAGDRNVFQAYGAAAGTPIVGELLKFSKGDWLAGKEADEIPEGTKLVAGMHTLQTGWQKWREQRPVDQRMGLLIDGYVAPPRHELGDDDESLWETNDDGDPKDPWQKTNVIQLVDPTNKEKVYTFSTSSKGGLDAITRLCNQYGSELAKRADRNGHCPLVRLDTGSYNHPNKAYGKIKYPQFAIVGWVDKKTLAPVKDPITDEIPY
jgi:hypothetical protein